MEQNFLSTNEIAGKLKVKPDSVRRGLCVNGHYLGLVPHRLPNGRLLWPEEKTRMLLNRTEPAAVER